MKKILPLLFLALFAATVVNMQAAPKRDDLITDVDSFWAVLQDIMRSPGTAIPPQVWRRARAVLITNQFKGAIIIGVNGGYGVVMVKKPDGRWSLPVLVSDNGVSLGLQLGGKSIETVFVMTDDQTPRLLFKDRFNIGVDAKAIAGPLAAETEQNNHPILSNPVLVYSKSAGLYAGATFKAAEVSRNDEANFVLYNTSYEMPELLYSDWVQPPNDVRGLMTYLQQLSP